MRKYNNQRKVMFLLIMLLAVSVGFALLSTTLKINGTTSIKSNTWDIHWDGTTSQVTTGSVTTTKPTVGGTNNDTVSFSVNLELPGDFYEFTIDAVNAGTIDGAISLISPVEIYDENDILIEEDLPDYINFSVKYADDTTPAVGDVLKKNNSKKYRVRIEIDEDAKNLPTTNKTYTYKYKVEYEQHKETCAAPVSFSADSWETIACNVAKNNTTAYSVGDTKTVDMGTLGTHTVRVANKSTDGCSELTSKTACGFVIEFADIITKHQMNRSYTNGSIGEGNIGGWKHCEMRAYLNDETEDADSIYNALPTELSSKIITTNVVSGYGRSDSSNFETEDKLYLLSTKELWNGSDGFDTAEGNDITKQLDYYKNNNVTISSNYASAKKAYNDSNTTWWLRSSIYTGDADFYSVANTGGRYPNNWSSDSIFGVSPAFRLAE